ncbi:TPA: hypothetical protein DEQ89_02475 [Candidatus Daviesbacteria bacterium]|nr:MAG: hypothetical protein A3C29_00605 [Candidatus Daviesbacteria bacterium RIFCSPHIGHO2_02_FULL_40_16]OGE42732.1 MAG: hypothetical protein A3A53_05430 [Candidatus Daviesbacteria bacterium RIFCSPLOWO2_01_FULL_39_23]HCE30858.1 hypothetical protein [Candidatus Daviesbacteria bacterium]
MLSQNLQTKILKIFILLLSFISFSFFSASRTNAAPATFSSAYYNTSSDIPSQYQPSIGTTCTDSQGCSDQLFYCWNDASAGSSDCGTGCNGGNSWRKYQRQGCWQTSYDWQTGEEACTTTYTVNENNCSTGDKYNSDNKPVMKAGQCGCTVGGDYKTCCDGTTLRNARATDDDNLSPSEAACDYTAVRCGGAGEPACGQSACGTPCPAKSCDYNQVDTRTTDKCTSGLLNCNGTSNASGGCDYQACLNTGSETGGCTCVDPKYSCSGSSCVLDMTNGGYASSTCNSECASSTCDGCTYPQTCNPGTGAGKGIQVCKGKKNASNVCVYDSGCNPGCSTCEARYKCSGSSCVADGTGDYTASTCGGSCTPTCNDSLCGVWTNGSCGAGGCSANQRQQTRTCPAGSTCSTSQCVNDPGCTNIPPPAPPPAPNCTINSSILCNADVSLGVSPNPGSPGSAINFSVTSGDASTCLWNTWTSGSVTGCDPEAYPTSTCTAQNPGANYRWTHYWQKCEGGLNNCSPQCSKYINFNIIPLAPATLFGASCPAPGTSTTLSWSRSSGADRYILNVQGNSYNLYDSNPSDPAAFSTSFTGNPAFIAPGNTYTWGVQACKGGFTSSTCSTIKYGTSFTCQYPACPDGAGTPKACGNIPGVSGEPSNKYSIGTCSGNWVRDPGTRNPNSPGTGFPYDGWCATNVNPTRGYCYRCDTSSGIQPWIQILRGDVHSNTGINAPGGP